MSEGSTDGKVETVEKKILIPRAASTTSKAAAGGSLLAIVLSLWAALSPSLPQLGVDQKYITIGNQISQRLEELEKKQEELDKQQAEQVKKKEQDIKPVPPTPLPVDDKQKQLEDQIRQLHELIDRMNKPPAPIPVADVEPAAEIKALDIAGKDIQAVAISQPIIVSGNGKKREWTTVTGKARVIPTPDGFVIIPTEEEVIVLALRVGTTSAIKVLQPEVQNKDYKSQIDKLTSDLVALSSSVSLLTRDQKSLETRVSVLESARPPPDPQPQPVPVTSKTFDIYVIEPVNASGVVNRTPSVAKMLNGLEAWNTKHSFRVYAANTPEALGKKIVADNLMASVLVLPMCALYDKSTGVRVVGFNCEGMTFDQLQQKIKEFGG